MSSTKSVKSTSVRRGRRTDADRRSGKWRLSVREVSLRKGRYKWTTWMVQGFKNEAGKWVRRKFRSRDAAEAFVARKQMENVVPGAPQHPVITCLTPEEVNEAEVAVARLKGCRRSDGRAVSLLEAATFYAEHLRGTVDIERVPMAEARRACLQDKEKRGVLRHHTTRYVDISLRAFEKWLCGQPRYAEQSVDEDWTPDVCEVTTDDILAYLGSLRSKKGLEAAPKTKNNARGDLRSFFNWCMGIEADRPLP
ncbi:MAG TPA: hypothetical protein VHM91_00400, partial [Verrucomicrobiales bacterium]|nr:hypothetical protein [Verrucomicrobiales bacterium]